MDLYKTPVHVLASGINPNSKLVYTLLFNTSEDCISKVSREYIASFLKVRLPTVAKALAELEQQGLIRVLPTDAGGTKLKYNYEVLV